MLKEHMRHATWKEHAGSCRSRYQTPFFFSCIMCFSLNDPPYNNNNTNNNIRNQSVLSTGLRYHPWDDPLHATTTQKAPSSLALWIANGCNSSPLVHTKNRSSPHSLAQPLPQPIAFGEGAGFGLRPPHPLCPNHRPECHWAPNPRPRLSTGLPSNPLPLRGLSPPPSARTTTSVASSCGAQGLGTPRDDPPHATPLHAACPTCPYVCQCVCVAHDPPLLPQDAYARILHQLAVNRVPLSDMRRRILRETGDKRRAVALRALVAVVSQHPLLTQERLYCGWAAADLRGAPRWEVLGSKAAWNTGVWIAYSLANSEELERAYQRLRGDAEGGPRAEGSGGEGTADPPPQDVSSPSPSAGPSMSAPAASPSSSPSVSASAAAPSCSPSPSSSASAPDLPAVEVQERGGTGGPAPPSVPAPPGRSATDHREAGGSRVTVKTVVGVYAVDVGRMEQVNAKTGRVRPVRRVFPERRYPSVIAPGVGAGGAEGEADGAGRGQGKGEGAAKGKEMGGRRASLKGVAAGGQRPVSGRQQKAVGRPSGSG